MKRYLLLLLMLFALVGCGRMDEAMAEQREHVESLPVIKVTEYALGDYEYATRDVLTYCIDGLEFVGTSSSRGGLTQVFVPNDKGLPPQPKRCKRGR